jgi:hypothetical protein
VLGNRHKPYGKSLTAINLRILKAIRLIWTFYSGYAFASMVITLSCLKLNWDADFKIFGILFWFKASTLGLLYLYMNSYKRKEYFYYQNLGVSKIMLWATTLFFDFSLFLSLNLMAHNLK